MARVWYFIRSRGLFFSFLSLIFFSSFLLWLFKFYIICQKLKKTCIIWKTCGERKKWWIMICEVEALLSCRYDIWVCFKLAILNNKRQIVANISIWCEFLIQTKYVSHLFQLHTIQCIQFNLKYWIDVKIMDLGSDTFGKPFTVHAPL